MKTVLLRSIGLLFAAIATGGDLTPPIAEKIPVRLTNHGITRTDDYFWMRERDNPKVAEYLEAENAYTAKVMAPVESLQQALYLEMHGRIPPADNGLPFRKNGYYYYARFEEGKNYRVYCRKKGSLESPEEIMLDVNALALGRKYCAVEGRAVSPDNRLLAYGVDTTGGRSFVIRIRDLRTNQEYPEVIPNTSGQPVWANDNRTLFYVREDSAVRPCTVFRHALGTDPAADSAVYDEPDKTFYLMLAKSKSERYIFINAKHCFSTETRVLDADHPERPFAVLQPRESRHEYHVEHFGNDFIIRTNLDAVNFRIVRTPVNKPGKAHWKEIVPHREDALVEGFEVFRGHLAVSERKDGLRQVRILTWDGKTDYYVPFTEKAYSAGLGLNPEFDTPVVRYSYSSLATPGSAYDYNMVTRKQVLVKRDSVVGGHDSRDYEIERFTVAARDGTPVPVSLVYRKGLKKDGGNPLLLYGYGAYGASTDPVFYAGRLSLLNRGFIYAIAHVRGGQEMGRRWYDDGRLFNKMNTFTDFIDCARALIAAGYTSRGRICAQGESAGGLLVAAAVNLEPSLFRAVIAGVPWVDVATSMLDSTIPLVTFEYDEWGDPRRAVDFRHILSYSPYDNVEAKCYPAMLVTAGLNDTQVAYWEPAKWVARMRARRTCGTPLLLLTNMSAGHSGSSGRYGKLGRIALEYAFLISQTGADPQPYTQLGKQ